MANSTRQSVLFPTHFSKPLHIAFDESATSSDGGAVLLRAVDQTLDLTAALATAFRDNRQGAKVRHSTAELLAQRIFGLALGYPDANDAGRMAADPMMRLLIDGGDGSGSSLASQPTLSRFENSASNTDMYRMGMTLAETVVAYHKKRLGRTKVKRITIDLDPTDTPNHGEQQELSFFNGHYGHFCYLPMLGFVSFNDEPDQYLFAAVLRSGVASARDGACGVLRRILAILRRSFRKARIMVRLDGGFAGPEMFDFLEVQRVTYIVGMAGNSVLDKRAECAMDKVRKLSNRTGQSAALFGETQYAAGSWKRKERRIIYKAEVVRFAGRAPRDNQRFLVTNLRNKPEGVYDVYRMRGESENRIKELQHGLRLDLTSCVTFKANQMRVLMTAAAYVLMQTLRSRLSHTSLARKQVESLRLMLLKIGAKVTSSVRRFVVRMAENHPWRDEWYEAARAWGAVAR